MILSQKLAPWYIANSVKLAFSPVVLSLNVQAAFWDTWHSVWREPR
jgi:hypothetical protein